MEKGIREEDFKSFETGDVKLLHYKENEYEIEVSYLCYEECEISFHIYYHKKHSEDDERVTVESRFYHTKKRMEEEKNRLNGLMKEKLLSQNKYRIRKIFNTNEKIIRLHDMNRRVETSHPYIKGLSQLETASLFYFREGYSNKEICHFLLTLNEKIIEDMIKSAMEKHKGGEVDLTKFFPMENGKIIQKKKEGPPIWKVRKVK